MYPGAQTKLPNVLLQQPVHAILAHSFTSNKYKINTGIVTGGIAFSSS